MLWNLRSICCKYVLKLRTEQIFSAKDWFSEAFSSFTIFWKKFCYPIWECVENLDEFRCWQHFCKVLENSCKMLHALHQDCSIEVSAESFGCTSQSSCDSICSTYKTLGIFPNTFSKIWVQKSVEWFCSFANILHAALKTFLARYSLLLGIKSWIEVIIYLFHRFFVVTPRKFHLEHFSIVM